MSVTKELQMEAGSVMSIVKRSLTLGSEYFKTFHNHNVIARSELGCVYGQRSNLVANA
jgi:hypothetical protein